MDPRPGWIEAAAEGARTVALGMLRGRGSGITFAGDNPGDNKEA